MRRRALEATGRWPEELTAFEDVYLWLRLREQGGFIHVPERLAAWRLARHPVALKPPGGQEQASEVFRRMVRERYGVDPIGHVSGRERAPRSILGYIGPRALRRVNGRATGAPLHARSG
jgi:hypothetical protein